MEGPTYRPVFGTSYRLDTFARRSKMFHHKRSLQNAMSEGVQSRQAVDDGGKASKELLVFLDVIGQALAEKWHSTNCPTADDVPREAHE
jgi:hypothetical protein